MRPGTRRSRGASVEYDYGDAKELLEFTPILDFQMKGLGYLNLEWGHGTWHGELQSDWLSPKTPSFCLLSMVLSNCWLDSLANLIIRA